MASIAIRWAARFVAVPKGSFRRGVCPTPGSICAFPRIGSRCRPQLPIGHLWSITLNDGNPLSVAARVDAPVMRLTCLILRLTVITLSRDFDTVRTDGDGTFYPRWGPSNARPKASSISCDAMRCFTRHYPEAVFLVRPVIRTGTVGVVGLSVSIRHGSQQPGGLQPRGISAVNELLAAHRSPWPRRLGVCWVLAFCARRSLSS